MAGERRARRLLVEFGVFVGVVAMLVAMLVALLVLLPDDRWGRDVGRVARVGCSVSFVIGVVVLIASSAREFRRGLSDENEPSPR